MCNSLCKKAINHCHHQGMLLSSNIPKNCTFFWNKYILNSPVINTQSISVQQIVQEPCAIIIRTKFPCRKNRFGHYINEMSLECHYAMPLACPPAPLRGISHLAITIVQEVKQSRALVDIKVQSLQMRPDLRICHDRLNYILCGNCERKLGARYGKLCQQREEEPMKLDAGYPESPNLFLTHDGTVKSMLIAV